MRRAPRAERDGSSAPSTPMAGPTRRSTSSGTSATLYALMSARDPELQAIGANTLLYWEAIRLASEVSRVFDFEGSMVEPIEHYFRGFGGRQTPYFCISKAGLKAKSALAARSARTRARPPLGRRTAAVASSAPPLGTGAATVALATAAALCASAWSPSGMLALGIQATHDRDAAILHGFTGLAADAPLQQTGRRDASSTRCRTRCVGLACIGGRARPASQAAGAAPSPSCWWGPARRRMRSSTCSPQPRYATGSARPDRGASWPSGHGTAAMTLVLCAIWWPRRPGAPRRAGRLRVMPSPRLRHARADLALPVRRVRGLPRRRALGLVGYGRARARRGRRAGAGLPRFGWLIAAGAGGALVAAAPVWRGV